MWRICQRVYHSGSEITGLRTRSPEAREEGNSWRAGHSVLAVAQGNRAYGSVQDEVPVTAL